VIVLQQIARRCTEDKCFETEEPSTGTQIVRTANSLFGFRNVETRNYRFHLVTDSGEHIDENPQRRKADCPDIHPSRGDVCEIHIVIADSLRFFGTAMLKHKEGNRGLEGMPI
jgi:hypothetical protein